MFREYIEGRFLQHEMSVRPLSDVFVTKSRLIIIPFPCCERRQARVEPLITEDSSNPRGRADVNETSPQPSSNYYIMRLCTLQMACLRLASVHNILVISSYYHCSGTASELPHHRHCNPTLAGVRATAELHLGLETDPSQLRFRLPRITSFLFTLPRLLISLFLFGRV
jgi:hypothetical protein